MENYINPLSTYKITNETKDKNKKKEYWEIAIGLQRVDKLTPSNYLINLAKYNIDGKLSNDGVKDALRTHYNTVDSKNASTKECDIVSQRIVELLEQNSFSFSPITLKSIHKFLFTDIFDESLVGKFRTYNITKNEPILNNDTVIYSNYISINDLLEYDFNVEKEHKYSYPLKDKEILNLTKFTSSIWQVHPFGEGNTRTTAVFIELYLRSLGFNINNKPFQEHSLYFRNALVRSNYSNVSKGIHPTFDYLVKFYSNILNSTDYNLNNEDLKIKENIQKADISL